MIDLMRLAHTVALAEELSFARAARRVHLSGPAFSRSIQALEDELGLTLFERNSRHVQLTTVGALFIERARRLLAQAADLYRDAAELRGGTLGSVRFAANPYASHALVAQLVKAVWRRRPGLLIVADQHDPDLMLDRLRRHEIEFCIADNSPFRGQDGVAVESLASVPMGFLCRAGHPLTKTQRLQPGDLTPFGIASSELPLAYRARLAEWLGLAPGHALPIAIAGNNVFAQWQLAQRTDVVQFAALPAFASDLRQGRLVQLPLELPVDMHSDICLAWWAGRTPSVAAQAVMEELRLLVSV